MDPQAENHSTWDNTMKLANFVIKPAAIPFTFIAAILVGSTAQTAATTSRCVVGGTKYTATGIIQFNYLIGVNILVCFYSIASTVLWALMKGSTHTLNFILTMVDMIAMILLFTGLSAASGLILYHKSAASGFCEVLDTFCAKVSASIAMTALAGIAYLIRIVFSFLHLYLLSKQ